MWVEEDHRIFFQRSHGVAGHLPLYGIKLNLRKRKKVPILEPRGGNFGTFRLNNGHFLKFQQQLLFIGHVHLFKDDVKAFVDRLVLNGHFACLVKCFPVGY